MTSPADAVRRSCLAPIAGVGIAALIMAGGLLPLWTGGSHRGGHDAGAARFVAWSAPDQPGTRIDPPEDIKPSPPSPPSEDEPRELVLHLTDGTRINGVLIEQNEREIVIRVGAIRMPVPRHRIDRVVYKPTIMERYHQMRDAVHEEDSDQILLIVRWLISVERYELALTEVTGVLERDPLHPDAVELHRLVMLQVELLRNAKPTPAAAPPQPVRRGADDDFPLLAPDQINLIDLMEVDLQKPPRLRIKRETMEQLFAEHAGDPLIPATREAQEAMLRRPPHVQLDLIFRLRARNLYDQIQIIDKPEAMKKFRENIHRAWLINACATTKCHGGNEAGRLWLYNRNPASDPTVYTNFLILDRFRTLDGRPLIDYDDPERSLLLHYGLSQNTSPNPHPPIPGSDGRPGTIGRPIFQSTDDRRYQASLDWIRSMYRPRPQYPVEYTPPLTPAAAAAAKKPEAEEAGPR